MTQGLTLLTKDDLNRELAATLAPSLAEVLLQRAPGHCMRVTDLDADLMLLLCQSVRRLAGDAQVFVLRGGDNVDGNGSAISSTKLVELRNPRPDGSLRPPLLVFLPNNLRTSAEDSFGLNNFEEVRIGDAYQLLNSHLLSSLPAGLRSGVEEILQMLRSEPRPWNTALAVARYLLTLKINAFDLDAAGASLFELGLVPDFLLFREPAQASIRVRRNLRCVNVLMTADRSERARVLDLKLADRDFQARLGAFLSEIGLDDPYNWTRRIVTDRANWSLSFDKWQFQDGGQDAQQVHIYAVETNLPTVQETEADPTLQVLIGHPIFALSKKPKNLTVSFRVDPNPQRVPALVSFVVDIVRVDTGSTEETRAKKVGSRVSDRGTINFGSPQKLALEEGWHVLRIRAVTADGDTIPLVDAHGVPLELPVSGEELIPGKRPNESEPFYVLPGNDVEVEPPQRAMPKADSLEHARIQLQLTELGAGGERGSVEMPVAEWTDRATKRATSAETLIVRFGQSGTVQIPISPILKDLEQQIIRAPDAAVSWRMVIGGGTAGPPAGDITEWPKSSATATFLRARSAFLSAIRQAPKDFISQAADYRRLKPAATAYAAAYHELIVSLLHQVTHSTGTDQQKAIANLRRGLAVDSVLLVMNDHHGAVREAALVGPTHPLRALWITAWTEFATDLISRASDGPKEHVPMVREALLRRMSPLNFPAVVPIGPGRLFTTIDNIHPWWSLYAPARERDPRGLLGEICGVFGLPEPSIGASSVDADLLAARVQRYLVQHPYIRTLTINVFNAGRATIISELLLRLQTVPTFNNLCYDVKLFVPDADAPGVGEALAELLSPASSVAAKEADAFATPSGNHLFPKLTVALRNTDEFLSQASSFKAHLTLLFDAFPPEEVGAATAWETEVPLPVHGLFQDFGRRYSEEDGTITWHRQPRHGTALTPSPDFEITDLLARVPRLLSEAAAISATASADGQLLPVITLSLGAEERALIHQIHEVSDWVFTIDRNLGIEFFDHGGTRGRPDYLIDHTPELGSTLSHRLVITSRSSLELEGLLRPALQQHGLDAHGQQAAKILEQLRSLSGRLALKLISAPTQRTEAIGLALARLYLTHQGALDQQVILPLDSHLELYRTAAKSYDDLAADVSFKRTDLALFDLNAGARVITCNLVEVKCYSSVGSIGAFNQLKASIAEQIAQSEQVLRRHFDPNLQIPDRPDRLLKIRELRGLIEFYLDRSVRYKLVSRDVEDEARHFLATLEEGYRLQFTRSAIVFDLDKPGTEEPEVEAGIEFHRIGVDYVRLLIATADSGEVETAPRRPQEGPESPAEHAVGHSESTVPRLSTAAFLIPNRDRSFTLKGVASAPAKLDAVQSPDPENPSDVRSPGLTEPFVAETGPSSTPADLPHHETGQAAENGSGTMSGIAVSAVDMGEKPEYDVLLGATERSPQYGILGEFQNRKIALDLNQTHTISLFGVQGGGKSYTLGSIVEMATMPIKGISRLTHPLAAVIFHYSPTQEYRPEFTSMVRPNAVPDQLRVLRERYGAMPQALDDIILVTPKDKLATRQREFPDVSILPLALSPQELQASHWKFLMGAIGSQSMYLRLVTQVMRTQRDRITVEGLREGIERTSMAEHLKELAKTRLELAAQYIDESSHMGAVIKPGRLVIVDVRDEFIEKDEALGLFLVLLQVFSDASYNGAPFNKLIVFDEAHKYIDSPELVQGLVEVVREMRHKGTSVMVASQDPPSVPISLIELSSQIIMHKFNSPNWLKHIQKANAALSELTPEQMANLTSGEAYVWSSRSTDTAFSRGAVKVRCRPRVTMHGGGTKTAVG